MQAHEETMRRYGHSRRPSLGKGMPISSLLLDLSTPQQRNFESISKDGISPKSEPVVFTFGQGLATYHNHKNQMVGLTNSFLAHEKETEAVEKYREEPPEEERFLKCVNYRRPSLDEESDEDVSDESLAGDDENNSKTCQTCNKKTPLLTADESQPPLTKLCEALCDDLCKSSTKKPSLSRTTSERQEFLAGMLHDAQEAVVIEPVLQMANLVEPQLLEFESEVKISQPQLHEPEIKTLETKQQPVAMEPKGDELKLRETERHIAEPTSRTTNAKRKQRQPIVTQPDDTDSEGEAEAIPYTRFEAIDMGSNDTEPSENDPLEMLPIITYPEESAEIVEHTEDLIRFDDVEETPVQDSELTIENLAKFDREYFRNKLAIAEALAQATMMTPSAASRRLAARKMEMDINEPGFVYDSVNGEFIPPRDLLLYLVR